MDINEQVIALESKIAYLEKDIDELNSVILSQGKQIVQLVKQLEEIRIKLDQKKDIDEVKEEKPPHY